MKGNLISIPVKINGDKEILNFIFDTGATSCVLDSQVAKKLNIEAISEQTSTGATGSSTYKLAEIKTLSIGGLHLSKLATVLVDLAHLSKNNDKIDGIIGYSLLKHFVCEIDYDNNKLYFYNSIDEIKNIYKNSLNIELKESLPIPQIKFSIKLKSGIDIHGKVLMDTGANPNFLINSNVVKQYNLVDRTDNKIQLGIKTLTGKGESYLCSIEGIRYGEHKEIDVPVLMTTDQAGVNAFPNLLGILGNGILHRNNWIFDYKNLKAYYKANKYSNLDFEYPCVNFDIIQKNEKMYFNQIQKKSLLTKKNINENTQIVEVNEFKIADYKKIKKLLLQDNIKLKIKYINKNGKMKKININTERKI